ncbi:oligoribonuclease [Gryllotalpicola kribbensis]|uniref:Oligoribonuclease n=1 Tax=Gryllotalpicola kribbensis TaxID=993084 RepID=A0ABP8B154_9MICO
MSAASDRLVWIDCEMTGLDPDKDELVEIAVVITDSELKPVAEGIDIVIKASDEALAGMGEFVTNMHTTSGLITEIPTGKSLAEAEYEVMEYVLKHVPDEGKAPLAGNTIGTDRMFITKYMPRLDAHLHYRSIDVSSIKELSRRWFPRVYFQAPEKAGGHRALSDILESIRELDYYRKAVFVAAPGPTSEEALAVATSVVNEWAPRM